MPETSFRHRRGDLRSNTAHLRRGIGDHQAAGLLHGAQDRVRIEGHNRSGVDHLARDALGGQVFGGGESYGYRTSHSHDGHIRAVALDAGLAERDKVLALGDLLTQSPETDVLYAHHRVIVTDGGSEKPLDITGR